MITHVFFDIWWVVLDSTNINVFDRVSAKFNLDSKTLRADLYDIYLDFEKWLYNSQVFHHRLVEEAWEELWNDLNKARRHYHHKYGRIYPEMLEFITDLRGKGYKCIALSDTNVLHKNDIRRKHGYDAFDDLILSCDVWLSKADDVISHTSKIFEFALKKYKTEWEKSVFVDDRDDNLERAQAIGFHTIKSTNPPEQVIKDVMELLGM